MGTFQSLLSRLRGFIPMLQATRPVHERIAPLQGRRADDTYHHANRDTLIKDVRGRCGKHLRHMHLEDREVAVANYKVFVDAWIVHQAKYTPARSVGHDCLVHVERFFFFFFFFFFFYSLHKDELL
jgi:hypothetical protein